MEGKSINISDSDCTGIILQGDVGGNVEAHIKSESENKPSSNTFNNDLSKATVANFANQVSDHARQQASHHISGSEQRTLAEAAAEIQRLLEQLEQTDPIATEPKKIAHVNDETTRSLRRRTVSALQAAGEAAIEEFLDNPYVNVGKAIVKAWMEAD